MFFFFKMTIIFKAKSNEAYRIKILAELLASNIKTGCFEIDQYGISLCMMDSQRRILIDLHLDANNFAPYKFKSKKMYVGINLKHFHTMLKSIKKKDSIELFIDDDSLTDLAIRVIPKENTRVTTSYIKIQNIQNLDIEFPKNYGKPVIIASSDYQKMCKDIKNIGDDMTVRAKNFRINFGCDAGGILKRNIEFGEVDVDDDSDSDDEEYFQKFEIEQLCRITKISGLSEKMHIFPGKPLLFQSNVGNLGKISIYIKSKEELEEENHTVDKSESDSDE